MLFKLRLLINWQQDACYWPDIIPAFSIYLAGFKGKKPQKDGMRLQDSVATVETTAK